MSDPLDALNPAQRQAVLHGRGPLLIIAGAGSGKTNTLAHRVAQLIVDGADARRILLLTFSRRAAAEMSLRAERILARATAGPAAHLGWSGTFHAVANRLLRLHAAEIGLDPAFTVLDRSDAADSIDVVRHDLGLAKTERRFPKKSTCLAIYSRVVNAQEPLQKTLDDSFPWCREHGDALKQLFSGYVELKERQHVLDYDDLLLYWLHLMGDEALAARVRQRFDHVLVDEYQDTNALQAQILMRLRPDGDGVTVVGDDAQSIYAFRAATVRNILDFPQRFSPPARVVTLEENYRSTQPILDAANAVISLAAERFTKNLRSARRSEARPLLVSAADEDAQVDYVVTRVLEAREAGVALKRQAVLFRAAHHSDALEIELSRRNIPFVKYGGLKFLEAAHVKDALCVLRWGENLRDRVAAFRVLQLLPGVGPGGAQRAIDALAEWAFSLDAFARHRPPAAARSEWPALCELLGRLRGGAAWLGQLGLVRRWYRAAPRASLRSRPRARAGSRSARADRGALSLARALPLGADARSAAGHRRPGGAAAARRRLLDPVDDPLGQGPGVGPGVHPQRRRRLDPLGHGDRTPRADRGGAAPVVRGDDARARSAAPDPPAALLRAPAAPLRRSARVRPADALHPRRHPRSLHPHQPRAGGGGRRGRGPAGAAGRRRRAPARLVDVTATLDRASAIASHARMLRSRWALLFAAVVSLSARPAAAAPLLFRDVQIFDGKSVSHGDVLVDKGLIRAVGRKLATHGATVIDGAGKTLLPGLIDSHTHASEDKALTQALVFGVTTELEMFGDPAKNRALREKERAGVATGQADLRSSGILATAPKGHGTEYGIPIPTVSRPEDAAGFVADRVKDGSDYLKIVIEDGKWIGRTTPTLDAATVAALVAAAHAHHLLAVVHIGSQAGARMALDAGADGLAHLFIDSPPAADFASFVAAHHAFVVPTLSVLMPICEGADLTTLTRDPLVAPFLDERDVAQLGRTFPQRLPAVNCTWALTTVKELDAANVPILAGTDALNPAVVHGASLHRELALLVEAGLTPQKALMAATSVPAARFGLSDRGRIAPGLRADLVLVDGNPLEDIRRTRAIVGVWKRGVPVDRAAYRERIEKERADAARERTQPPPPGSDPGAIADFEDGKLTTRFGSGLTPSTDSLRGGTSTVALEVVPGGAAGSKQALAVTGETRGDSGFSWAGVMFSPGAVPMAAANLSAKKTLHFFARGDGKRYRVMIFARHLGFMPATRTFVAGAKWSEVSLPLADFDGIDGRDLMGILWTGGPQPGKFAFTIDQLELR